MKKFCLLLLLAGTFGFAMSQTPVPMASQTGTTYTETFADIANWGPNFASGAGATRFGVASGATGTVPAATRVTANTTFSVGTSGGVQKGTQTIVLLATGSPDNTTAAAFDFFMDFTGVTAGNLSFDWASVNNSTGDRKGSLRVYASTDGTNYSDITGAQVLNITNNAATSGQVSVALPSSFSNSATARLRFYYYNGTGGTTGSRPKISIDNLTVTGTNSNAATASIAGGANATETGSTPSTITLSFSPATTSDLVLNYSSFGTAGFGSDYRVMYGSSQLSSASGTVTVPANSSQAIFTIIPTDDNEVESSETAGLTFGPIAGYSTNDLSASVGITDNDVPPTVSVATGVALAEPSTNGSFLITLSQAGPASGVTINYTLSGTATKGSDYSDPLSGTVTIASGATTATVSLPVIDDAVPESLENVTITINSVSGGYVIATGAATINARDNDVAPIFLTGIYRQNFDSLANTGTENFLPIAGWALDETGGGGRDNEQYAADPGGSNTGDTYSYGATGSSERALGSLRSGSLIASYGAYFTNSTGKTINSLKISYTGEQWRLGTAGRADRLDFSYSLDAANIATGTWTAVDALDFISPNTGTAGTKVGNDDGFRTFNSSTITGLSIPAGATVFIRWDDADASGADDGLAIDDLEVEANPVDKVAPSAVAYAPANGTSDVAVNGSASITFNEAIAKGTGTISITKNGEASPFISYDINDAAVTISGNTLSIPIRALAPNTAYHVLISNGSVQDLSGNNFSGITDPTAWSFTTGTLFYAADFQNCGATLADGFTAYSQTGSVVWACTTFGRDPANPAGAAAFPYGVQINGFSGGTNVPNVDWLISPSLDLTGTAFPLLSFYSRTAFNGLPLQLKVSTNYNGGDPTLATWTDVNGKFPAQASNIWTLSSNINLAAFRQPNVHFAFVYTSTDDDGARWTLDDVRMDNSPVAPPPTLTVSTNDIQFSFVKSGSTAEKSFVVTGDDLTSDMTLTASPNFLLSKDGTGFTSTITYAKEEASNVPQTVFVRFAPNSANDNFTGSINVSTGDLSTVINLKGSSIDPATTLEVVNWNIEWFGSTGFGPTNEDQQEQNISTILKNVGADIFALAEVVSEERLARVVSQMPGYSYVLSNFGSHTNTSANPASAINEAQKLAFVYKTELFSNISTEPLLSAGINSSADLSNPAYSYWSSGRFPYMMTADINLNCVTKKVHFILVHAKANTSPTATSYARRKSGADTLYQTLNALYPDDRIIILGDFNDDLDQSITAGFTTTSWSTFTNDHDRFTAVTLPLSLSGKKSTVSYNDVIDHVVVSNEMQPYYMPSSATVLSDVSTLVSNYGTTTTDHFPVFTRYAFEKPAPPTVTNCPQVAPFCPSADGNYSIPAFTATSVCGIVNYRYSISGATERNGDGNDASGHFNTGSSTITWYASDRAGNETTCTTTVTVNEATTVAVASKSRCESGEAVTLTAVAGSGSAMDYRYSWSVPAGVTDPGDVASFSTKQAGSYSVVLTRISTGCTGSGNATVTVNPDPVVSLSSAVKCASDPAVQLSVQTGEGNYNYQWTVPQGAANPGNVGSFPASVAGNYTVIVTNTSTGCSANTAATLTVNANPVVNIPDASALPHGVVPNTVYIGYAPASSLTLNAVTTGGMLPYAYSWSDGNTTASRTVNPSADAVYSVTVTDNNGCKATAAKAIDVVDVRAGKRLDKVIVCHKGKSTLELDASSVADHLAHGDMLGSCENEAGIPATISLKVAPNPSSSAFVVLVQDGRTGVPVTVTIFDLFGRQVEKKDKLTIPLRLEIGQNYRPGMYFLEVRQGDDRRIQPLIKL